MNQTTFKKLDVSFFYIIAALCIISILTIHGIQHTGLYGNQKLGLKQGINYVIGTILLILFLFLDPEEIEKLSWPLYGISFFLVAILPFMPGSIVPSILGAKRWIQIPLLGTLQPSEFLKVSLLMVIAHLASKHHEKHTEQTLRTDLFLIGKTLLVTLPPALFVYKEPDTGMPLLFLAGCFTIVIISGVQKRLVLPLTLIPIAIVSSLIFIYFQFPNVFFHQLIPILSPHQQARILGWLAPGGNGAQAYQTDQSLMAVGSGEVFGKGLGNGSVYIPEKNTDFIFSSVAEEGGFIAAAVVITLFFLLLYRMVIIAQISPTKFGTYFASGAIAIITLQIFQNIGMTVGLMPVKGISLPFLSYGGSSIFSNMIIIGILMSIRKAYRKYMFSSV